MYDADVLIVGGGLAGLCCARRLCEAEVSCRVFEASDAVGGRARTDPVEGFLLDRGFQVLLTAYDQAQRVLDFDGLELARFEPGALVRFRGRFHRFVDPWRRPGRLLSTAVSPVATLGDKLRVARLRRRVCHGSLDLLFLQPETTTQDRLRDAGLSDRIIECFFRPFLGGVFLERKLGTSSRMFDFVFRMFATGDAALPARGMGAMAQQIAAALPEETVQIHTPVQAVRTNAIRLADGRELSARAVVVACDAPSADRLLGEQRVRAGQGVTCLYFAAGTPPIREPILVLNGDGVGPINNLCVPSQVVPSYAPPDQSLISVTVLGTYEDEAALAASVHDQLENWFGPTARTWRHLRTYSIPFALPAQIPPALSPVAKPVQRGDGIFVCGDYLDTASIQGAMLSGRRAADAVIGRLLSDAQGQS